jgi:HD-like signal output (HDOD) protein
LKDIKKIVSQINDFPTLPTIYTSLLDLIGNPRASVADVANIVAQDIAASTKILKAVNSSVYSLQTKVDTITQAIFHLGFNEVKNLVVTLSVLDMFETTSSVQSFNMIDLWKHSIAVAVTTRNIGKEIGIKNVENYFLAGLIHDIGKFIFLKTLSVDYIPVIKYLEKEDINIEIAENEILGINHCIVGELLVKRWGLPSSITNSIRYHSTGFIGDEANLQVACVHLADIIARTLELGYPGDNLVPEPNEKVWSVLKMQNGAITSLIPKILTDFEQSVSILLTNK